MITLTAQTTIELDSDTFAVCVVDGERRCPRCWRGSPTEHVRPCNDFIPPAWLTELTEPCQTCNGTARIDWRTMLAHPKDPMIRCDCFDGRPAVEVVELCDRDCAVEPPLCVDGYQPLGRGTVEHILPVELNQFAVRDHPHIAITKDGDAVWWWPERPELHLRLLDVRGLRPVQYVGLVRMENS